MMREETGDQAENLVLFCIRPWRVMGAAVAALVSITLAACGGGGSGAGSVAKPDKLTIVGAGS